MNMIPTSIRILFNGGDNMLGRAVQLSFPVQAPGEALLRDSCPAQHYLDMCLHPTACGEKERSLDEIRRANSHGKYLWGDYLKLRLDPPPDLRLMNLETALTRTICNDDIPWEKGINYHLHLDNFEGVMSSYENVRHSFKGSHHTEEENKRDGKTDESTMDKNETAPYHPSPICITLANNHVIDFGQKAFIDETLPFLESYTLQRQGSTQFAGAGRSIHDASRPAHWTISRPTNDIEVYVVAAGSMDSGVPRNWGAKSNEAGIFLLPRLDSLRAVEDAIFLMKHWMYVHGIPQPSQNMIGGERTCRDRILILSIHWGPNWAYRYAGDNQEFRRKFAHACIDQCGVDVIYGHSSHHIRGIEAHNGKLIIYGAGDLINDYEGFMNKGDEQYCEYGALFVADIALGSKDLRRLTLVPTFMNNLQLKLLCPNNNAAHVSEIWNPPTQKYEGRSHLENASCLCQAINELTNLDSGRKQGLKLRVSKEPDFIDSEFVLVYP